MKTLNLHERKAHIKMKERVYEFPYYGFLGLKADFYQGRKLVERRKMIFPSYLRKFYILRNENDSISVFFYYILRLYFLLAWNIMFTGYHKVLGLNFVEMENMVFFESKS